MTRFARASSVAARADCLLTFGAAAEPAAFADVHGLSWQRFYNLAWMAYGSDLKRYRYVTAMDYLPKERAEGCSEEYDQVAFAFRKLIGPHLRVRPAAGKSSRRAFRPVPKP